jgi:hypothetical protein
MWKLPLICACLGLFGACVDDAQDVADNTASTAQASTIVDACATGQTEDADGATNGFQGDSYTRSANRIDTLCGCADWQVDANANGVAQANIDYPDCRPWTWFDVTVTGLGTLGTLLQADVPNWETTSADMCMNSQLDMAVEENVGGTWYPVWPTTAGHFFVFNPTFNSSTGKCDDLHKGPTIHDIGVYRIKARAIRGLDQFNHGYAGVVLSAIPEFGPS